jgi:hypothetical protein
MSTLGDSPYQAKLLDTFWDMADIFFFKRKDGSEVEKLFVDYWFGVEFDDENTNGELANTEDELIQLLKMLEIPTKKPMPAYDFLWAGGKTKGYATNADKCRARWAMFREYGIFKDGYRGSGNTQGNIFVDVPLLDGSQSRTVFSCHTDSVHRTDGFQSITYTEDPESGYIIQSDNNECLGGDDGTGVWLMTKLIEAGVPGRYIFHRAEEVGGRGSGWIETKAPELLAGYDRAVAFDRKAKHSLITYQSCSRCCSDEFADDLGGHLMLAAKRYYLERFQAGDPIVMFDVQAPVPEQRTGWRNIPGARQKKVTSTNQYGYTSTKWEIPREEYTYSYTPKNEFWETLIKLPQFAMMAPEGDENYMFSTDEMRRLVQTYATDYPEEMMGVLEEYLKFKEEIWKTDTGGSFTDTANYTDLIAECMNLSCGYYNAHTQSEYQDYAFLEVFLEGLIATPWEELYTADPPERGYQSTGYWGYRDTYIAPSRTILDSASDDEVSEVRRKQTEQKERRKREREEKKMMMEEFGYYDPDVAGEIYGSDDDWEEAPEAISSFWDDMDEPDTEYSTFYMQ